MRVSDIQVGAWIIWEGDTYPHPRKILRIEEERYILNMVIPDLIEDDPNGKYSKEEYIEDEDWATKGAIRAARLCREDEIPEWDRPETYKIY